VSTGDLNRVIRQALEANSPPMRNNHQPKIFYATQIGTHPPTIVLFTNGPELFDDTYVRYLTKVLRDSFSFSEVAIKVILRAKGEGAGRPTDLGESDRALEPRDDADEVEVHRPQERKRRPAAVEPLPLKRKQKKKSESETWDL
jgi:GTP-binding protein